VQDSGRPDLESLSVFLGAGVVPRSSREDNHNQLGEDMGKYLVVEPGDIVFNKLRTWQGGLGASKYLGLVSPAYFVCRPKPNFDPTFLQYLLLSSTYLQELTRISKWQPPSQFDIGWEQLKLLPIVAPDLARQKAITEYLDRETTRIDALIVKKQRMIQLLDEHLKCLIDCELKSNARIPLKYLVWFQEGPGIMAEDFLDEGTPLVRVSGVGGEYVTLDGCNYLDPQKVSKKWAHFALEDGDYVISASATMGVASKVDSEAIGSIPYTGLIRFKPLSDKVEMEFIRYFLVSSDFMHQIDKLKTGAAMQHFGPIHLGQISIPHLAVGDQIRIARKLAETDRARKEMKDLLVKQISLLEERRRAMITDAVTGVLAIPEVAA
jgi:type I restriction enzyme S subunit